MTPRIFTPFRLSRALIASAAVLCATAAAPVLGEGEAKSSKTAMPPGVIFSTPLPDVPGNHLVVVALKFPPSKGGTRVDHRHPGSVYVYVTEGTVRLGVEGQPVREVHKGESFFEPPGSVH